MRKAGSTQSNSRAIGLPLTQSDALLAANLAAQREQIQRAAEWEREDEAALMALLDLED
jgi:hypothetical protein